MKTIIASAVLLLATPALAAGPLDGRWAFDREVCANDPANSDVLPMVIKDNEIQGYESTCRIETLTPIGIGESAWRAQLACSGEGEEWKGEVLFALHRDGDGKPITLIEIYMEDGNVSGYYPCD